MLICEYLVTKHKIRIELKQLSDVAALIARTEIYEEYQPNQHNRRIYL